MIYGIISWLRTIVNKFLYAIEFSDILSQRADRQMLFENVNLFGMPIYRVMDAFGNSNLSVLE